MGIASLRDRLAITDSLSDIFARLNHLILHSRPEQASQQEAMAALMRARDQVGDEIDKLLSGGVKEIAEGFAGPLASLAAINSQLAAVEENMNGVKAAVDLAARVIQVAAQLALLFA